jgi:hypothetical protein
MAEGGDAIEWDFVTLVTLWNFYGLPVLLVAFAIADLFRRSRSRDAMSVRFDGLRSVSLIGLIHYALGVRALVHLAQELLTLRAMGIPESFFNLVTWSFSSVVNPLLGLGLGRRRPGARRWAIAWYVLLSAFGIFVVFWRRRYHVAVDPGRWPEYLIANALPLFLLGAMFVPRVKRVFDRVKPPKYQPITEETDGELPPGRALNSSSSDRSDWGILSLLCLLLQVIVLSTVIVDVADWGSRVLFEQE